jgi:TolB-like protein
MHKVFIYFSFILICSCSTTSNYYSFDDALDAGTKTIQNGLQEEAHVAILDFKSDNGDLSAYVIEELYDKLINLGKWAIMERNRIDTITTEVGYQLSGEVDDNEIINIGHQLGADYVVTGQIAFSGEAYRLRIFLIDIEKGRRVASSSLNINQNDQQINYFITNKTTTKVQENQTDENSTNHGPLGGRYDETSSTVYLGGIGPVTYWLYRLPSNIDFDDFVVELCEYAENRLPLGKTKGWPIYWDNMREVDPNPDLAASIKIMMNRLNRNVSMALIGYVDSDTAPPPKYMVINYYNRNMDNYKSQFFSFWL